MVEEPSCLLRRLTLCDGQVVADVGRAPAVSCWCARLERALEAGDALEGSSLRHARARSVARAEETLRVLRARERRLSAPPF